jgi:signal transduction histidine kinase
LGIGLSICRSIIDFHDGRIWATSEAGRGTSFRFSLPLISNA